MPNYDVKITRPIGKTRIVSDGYSTHKATRQGKTETLARKNVRAAKYAVSA